MTPAPREPAAPNPRRALGQRGEALVADWYERAGYEILDRNWRRREGELDLILRRGRAIVFCEVKTRSSNRFGAPIEAITPSGVRVADGTEPLASTPQEYAADIDKEETKWSDIVRKSGAKVQ